MKIKNVTTADKYLKRIKDTEYDIEVGKYYKVCSTGVCLLLAGLNVSHIAQLNDPAFIDIARQAALTISFAYSMYYANNVYQTNKRNEEKLGRLQNLNHELTKEESVYARDKQILEPNIIEENTIQTGRHR